MMSTLGVSRQSPLGSDFQKVGMTAGTGMGCGEGPQLPGNGELGEQICCVCMSVSLSKRNKIRGIEIHILNLPLISVYLLTSISHFVP